jgi:transcriptional regulator with XRE-family HTH domain
MGFPSIDDLLGKYLEKRGMTLREFARRAGVPPSLVSRIRHGKRSLPTGRIEAWADLLGLTGHDRAEFIDAAMWTAVPKRLRPWLEAKLVAAKPGARRR